MKNLKIKDIHSKEFECFGKLISETNGDPLASNDKIKYWDKISEVKMGEIISTGIVKGFKKELQVSEMERHQETPEMLVNLEGKAVVVLGKSNEKDEIKDIKAFTIKQGQGLILERNIWHSVPIPINDQCKFLVVFKSGTPGNDLEVKQLNTELNLLK